MIVTLVRPPAGYSTGKKPNIKRGLYLLPQSIIYLGEALRRGGHKVHVIDSEEKKHKLRNIIDEIGRQSPDIVGITTTTPSWPFVLEIAKRIRKSYKDIKIVLGGPHATYEHAKILKDEVADAVFTGEAEVSFPRYVAALEGDENLYFVPGIAYLKDGRIIHTKRPDLIDIDKWGRPAYDLLNIEAYDKVSGVSISAMRGCPYSCGFCLVPKIHRKHPLLKRVCRQEPRVKKAETIFGEMTFLYSKYGVKDFSFIDPTFTYYTERVNTLCDLLIKERSNFQWCCQTRVDCVNGELLNKMHKAGCVGILFGVESESEEVRRVISKKTQKKQIIEAIRLCKKNSIHPTPSLIMGMPKDTEKRIKKSIEFAERLNDDFELNNYIQYNTFLPSPGSILRGDLKKYGMTINPAINLAYYVIVPVTSSYYLPYEAHLRLWHTVWKTFFREYYDMYLEVEDCAFKGENPLLDDFKGMWA